MAQSNGGEELSSKLWAILDDYRNLEMPARYGNIDWAEHAILALIDEVIGEDEADTDVFWGIETTARGWATRIKPQNELRAEQRLRLGGTNGTK